jgi:hypothetical protein
MLLRGFAAGQRRQVTMRRNHSDWQDAGIPRREAAMRGIVLTLMVAGVLAAASGDAVAQDQVTVVKFHFATMKPSRTGVVTLVNVRAFVDSAQIEAEEAELSRVDGRLRLALKGGGTVTWPQRTQVEVVTGPYERLQRDEGLTRMLQSILFRLPRTPVKIMALG